jgi:alpha-tubulin suppressor-like RCC1 family protein
MGSPLTPQGGYVWDIALTEPTADTSGANWTYLSEGIGKTCTILDDGTIWCHQGASLEQEGMDSDWEKVATSTAGYQGFTCGIKTNGELWCWGNNEEGQLGDGTTEEQPDPVQIGSDTWEHVSLGTTHGCGIKTDGSVWCWGANDRGQLGDPAATDPSPPIQVTTATDWESLQTAANETCAIKTNGQVWCWGGFLQADQEPSRVGPTTWKQFATNGTRQCGIRDDDTLWCKGSGLWGEHGSEQANLLDFQQVGNADDWASVVTGFEHTCALKDSGEAWCWGHNNVGQIGTGALGGIKPTPARVAAGTSFQDADAGQAHACAIAANGALYCTGSNTITQLGLGRMTLHVQSMTRVGNATNWANVSAGIQHTCAVRDDGSLWCTGFNGGGQLGLGEGVNPMGSFMRVGDESDWVAYEAAPTWSCALKDGGELYCFGINEAGQLGTGDTDQRFVPTRVGSDTYADFDTAGYYTDRGHTCAIRDSDDTLWCWGHNDEGQLGTGDEEPVMGPTQIGDATWAEIGTGGSYTCGIQTDGSLWCWGAPRLGALGLGQITGNVLEPTQVGSATDWRTISTGFQHTCATKSNDTAWCWGDLALVGNGEMSAGNTLTPVQVGTDANWAEITADYTATWGIKTDGSLWSWGMNRDGQLGTGDAWYSTPQRVLDGR